MSKNRQLHIEIRTAGIYVNSRTFVPFEFSNFKKENVLFSTGDVHTITCVMQGFDKGRGELLLEITDYSSYNRETFISQQPKTTISSIRFVNIQFEKLQPLLSYFKKSALEPYLATGTTQTIQKSSLHKIKYKAALSKITFRDGKVLVPHTLSWYKQSRTLVITNPHVIKDYEHIKFYFAKIFGRKSIDIEVTAKSTKEKIELVKVTSPHISSIDHSSVRVLRTKMYEDMTAPRNHSKFPGDNLLTIDDIIAEAGDEGFGNLDCTEKELLFHIIEKLAVRNARELRYLSESVQENAHPLYINLKPEIGFVFTYSGEERYHFIWELLNSNATYVWGVPKTKRFKEALKAAEIEIGLVKSMGRTHYRMHVENSADMSFHYVVHKKAKSTVDDPFPMWIKRVEELLI